MKPTTFPELFQEAEGHEDYWVAGAILEFTEDVVREMEHQGITRTELARRLGATPAYVTKLLRGKVNFTLATMVRLARALGAELRVQLAAARGGDEAQLVDDAEMVKILSNERLLARVRTGSAQVRERRGRFVE